MKYGFVFFLLGISLTIHAQDKYYISPGGNDNDQGSISKPFSTLGAALDVISERRLQGDTMLIDIIFRQGTYRIKETIHILPGNSNLNILAYQDEEVILSGGVSITQEHIQTIKLPDRRGRSSRTAYMVDLKKAGITNLGRMRDVGFSRPYGVAWAEVFINKSPMHLSRWPNKDMIPMGKVLDPGSVPREGDFTNRGGTMKYDSLRINNWVNEEDARIAGYFKWGYADDMLGISSIDTIEGTITTAIPTLYGFGYGEPWQNWYGVNIFSELDYPGEYYISHETGMLYFIPEEENIESLDFSILEEPFISMEGISNVAIRGIIFECSRGLGIALANTRDVRIEGCTFRNLGSLGITVGKGIEPFSTLVHEGTGQAKAGIVGNLQQHMYVNTTFNREAGNNNSIISCKFYQLGAGGISLGGGNRLSLEPGNNLIENCLFHNLNRIEKSYRPAVELTGVGNRVSHCEIYNAPSMAILMQGNDHIIEYNYIHDVCLEVRDQGAVYYGRDPSERGSVVRYNFFENIPDHFHTCAVYHDDGACGMTVHGNVFNKAGRWTVLVGGGSDNVYYNNIFIGSQIGIHVDNRLANWGASMLEKGGIVEKRLNAVNYQEPPYKTRYPQLSTYFNSPEIPSGNLFENNVFVRTGQVLDAEDAWLEYKNSNWIADQDVGFADEENNNFSLNPKSIIYEKIPAFREIPFHVIGLYETRYFPGIRKANGMVEIVNEQNRDEWLELQSRIEAYTVTDPHVLSIVERLKTDRGKSIFPNPHPGAQWFADGNFGLFMHWGPHSITGSQPSWAMIRHYPHGYEEKFSDPDDYFALADDFYPQTWDPDMLCKAASQAGMSYIVLTAKHHDGFGLWPSKYGNYNIGLYHPGMDLLEPYVEACRNNGLKVGLYFSQRDWHFPEYPVVDQNFNFYTRSKYPIYDEELNNERYERWLGYTMGQLNELLTSYGQIDVLWFDGLYWPGKEDEHYSNAIINWVRSLQPGIVINDRWYKTRNPDAIKEETGLGDFATVEWKEPKEGMDKWWEFTTSWSDHWGYSELRFDDREALNKLILARSLGGNFLLDIGPSPEGNPPDGFYPYMDNLAKWIRPNKDALFGPGFKAVDPTLSNVPLTRKEAVLYLHLLPGTKENELYLKTSQEIASVKFLESGRELKFKQQNVSYSIPVKKNKLDGPDYYVLEVRFK